MWGGGGGGGRWPPPSLLLPPAEAIHNGVPSRHTRLIRTRNAHDNGEKKKESREKSDAGGRLRRRRVLARSPSPSSCARCDEPRDSLVSSSAQTRSRRRPSSKLVGRVVERANKNPRKTSNHNENAQHEATSAFNAPPSFCFACTFIPASIPQMRASTQLAFIRQGPKSQALFMAREALQRWLVRISA